MNMGGSPLRYAYVGFYTLTDAQRGRELLSRRGIRAHVVRMPSGPGVSCAFGLRLPADEAEPAKRLLEGGRLRLGKTVYRRENGDKENDLL